jgi:hypothetical protein
MGYIDERAEVIRVFNAMLPDLKSQISHERAKPYHYGENLG